MSRFIVHALWGVLGGAISGALIGMLISINAHLSTIETLLKVHP